MNLDQQYARMPAPPCARARGEFLPFHVPSIDEDDIAAVVEVLKSGWLTTGTKAHHFEQRFAEFVGAKHAVAVNSATAALHIALEAAGIGPGDEVIVPTMTFAASAEVVLYRGARPVLVDCQADTLNIDPAQIAKKITPRTKAVMPVHIAGQPCEMDSIEDLARAHRLKVIEDAAHALPARDGARRIGAIGDITCFSFYATKTITTGEGGMATTDNGEWADKMRVLSLHGISHDAWNRYSAEGSWYYEILHPGYKYNLTDMAAALGLSQLNKCRSFWTARQRISTAYNYAFADVPEIRVPACRPDVEHAWHLYVIQLDFERLRLSRGQFIAALKDRNIGASVHFMPLHLHPYYRRELKYQPDDCPVASQVYERIVSLPIYPKMSDGDVADVIDAVREIVAQYRR